MPQFQITVSGLTPDDAVDGILALAARFQGHAAGPLAADVPSPGPGRRRRSAGVNSDAGPVEQVPAPAPAEAAGGLPDVVVGAADAEGSSAVGEAERGADDALATRPEEAGPEADTAPPAGGGEATGEAAGGAGGEGAAALPDAGAAHSVAAERVDEAGRPTITLEVVQGLAKALGAARGIGAVQSVFAEHAVKTPADIDPMKLIALKASFDRELAVQV